MPLTNFLFSNTCHTIFLFSFKHHDLERKQKSEKYGIIGSLRTEKSLSPSINIMLFHFSKSFKKLSAELLGSGT